MKPLLVTVLFSIACLTAHAADASLTGEWKIQRSAAGRESTQTCTFAQKDSELTGNCSADKGSVPVTGKIEGNKATWTYRSDSEGGEVTVVYKGTIESGKQITGTVTAVEFSIDGEFTATRSK